jgi:hypothetical protein
VAGGALAATTAASTSLSHGGRAYKLYTGPDNASPVLEGTIDQPTRTDVVAIHSKESPAHSSYDRYNDPELQFVAENNIGSGHKWRMIRRSEAGHEGLLCGEDRRLWRHCFVGTSTEAVRDEDGAYIASLFGPRSLAVLTRERPAQRQRDIGLPKRFAQHFSDAHCFRLIF